MQSAGVENIPSVQSTVRTASTQNFRLSERIYPSNMASPAHAHVKNYIIVTLDGCYVSTFGTKTEEFKRWTVSYHSAGALHTSRYGNKGAKVLYVELPIEQLKHFPQQTPCHLTTISLQGGLAEWTARQLYSEFSSPDQFSPIFLEGLVLQLVALVFRFRREIPQCLPTWLGQANEIIHDRFMEPVSLAKIAKAVNVHPVHMAREFRRYYRCTVGDLIRKLRVEYACTQLTETTRSLSDIALAAGFADQSHFTVAFKQQVGTAPSRYRRATQTDVMTSAKHHLVTLT
jgi:AraC family transcriptional regulator